MSEQIEQEKTIHYNDAKIWQIAFFSMNNTAANLYLALMGYISYYANSMAGFSVVLISSLVTAMNIFDGVTDPVVGFLLDKSKGRFGKFRPFMVAGNILMAVSPVCDNTSDSKVGTDSVFYYYLCNFYYRIYLSDCGCQIGADDYYQ